jgi:hypothetical protein
MPFKLPSAKDMARCLYSDRFQIEKRGQQTDGTWCWALMDTELGRPVEVYAGYGSEYHAGEAATLANQQAAWRSIITVPAAFTPYGYPQRNTWCLVCGAWGISSSPDCDCHRSNLHTGRSRAEIQQANRDLVLIAIALSTMKYPTCNARDVAWRLNWKRAKTITRMNTLFDHGLVTARTDGPDWFRNGTPSKCSWKLTAVGAKRLREIVPQLLAEQEQFAAMLGEQRELTLEAA